ncbi:MAG: DUF1573 domain-containing protein [Candidatus Cryptobacteroides sp.]
MFIDSTIHHPAIVAVSVALLILTLSACGNRPAKKDVKDIITSENTEADLGKIREADGTVFFNLVAENATADTLYPVAVHTRCTCLTGKTDRKPVPPGGKVKVEAVYNPAYRKGIIMEEVMVQFAGRRSGMSLIVKGEVIPMKHPVEEDHPYNFGNGIHLSHSTLHFGKMKAGESKDIYIRCASDRKKETDLSFAPQEQFIGNLHFREKVHLGKEGRDTVNFRFTMPEGIASGDTLTFPLKITAFGKPLNRQLTVKAIAN